MTYYCIYKLRATKANRDELTLYEAVKALAKAAKDGATGDASHIACGERCVAFFCRWRDKVRATDWANAESETKRGRGATAEEAKLIAEWNL
jgi:hypothetical protein